jgi:hypothetical protein
MSKTTTAIVDSHGVHNCVKSHQKLPKDTNLPTLYLQGVVSLCLFYCHSFSVELKRNIQSLSQKKEYFNLLNTGKISLPFKGFLLEIKTHLHKNEPKFHTFFVSFGSG